MASPSRSPSVIGDNLANNLSIFTVGQRHSLPNSLFSVFSILSLLCMNAQFKTCFKRWKLSLISSSLILPMILRFMSSQWLSWFECFSTKITRNGDSSDVISFNVVLYSSHTSLLSTHLAYSCSTGSSLAVRISIFTEYHHWLHLLVQTLNVCEISCVICERNSCFNCGL